MAVTDILKEHSPDRIKYWNDPSAALDKKYQEEDHNKSGPKRKRSFEEELLMTFMWMRY